jgi:hypothetical protein
MLLFWLSSQVFSDEIPTAILDVDIFGASYHTNRYIAWREHNPGLGLTVGIPNDPNFDFVVSGGTYIDSMDNHARYIMGGFRPIIGDRFNWHGALVLEGGYMHGSGSSGVAFIPVLQFGYDRYMLCVTGMLNKNSDGNPGNNPNAASTSMIAFFLEVTAYRF